MLVHDFGNEKEEGSCVEEENKLSCSVLNSLLKASQEDLTRRLMVN